MKMLTMLMMTSLMIPALMMMISILVSKKNKQSREKMSPFECGFDPAKNNRAPFSLRFFLVSIIFLIFDVEIILLMPLAMSQHSNNAKKMPSITLMMLLILILGLAYEWDQGALNWAT